MPFSTNTADTYKRDALASGSYAFSTAGWACELKRTDALWKLEVRFTGTKRQRQNHRAALADVVKAFVPPGARFNIQPGGRGLHTITWARDAAEEISLVGTEGLP